MGFAKDYLPRYTVRDYESWEGDWELIEGIPYALVSPSFRHQRVVGRIFRFLDEQLEDCPECSVVSDVHYIIDEHSVLRPDVMIVCGQREEKVVRTPEVIFEVVSPSTVEKDERLKYLIYEREGVKKYILVYPDLRKVRVFELEGGKFRKVIDAASEVLSFEVKGCSLKIDLSRIWEA